MTTEIPVLAAKLSAMHSDVNEIKGAVAKLIVLEERQVQQSTALERAFNMMEKLEARLIAVERALPPGLEARVSAIERQMPEAKRTTHWVDRIVWAALAALAMYVWDRVQHGGN